MDVLRIQGVFSRGIEVVDLSLQPLVRLGVGAQAVHDVGHDGGGCVRASDDSKPRFGDDGRSVRVFFFAAVFVALCEIS